MNSNLSELAQLSLHVEELRQRLIQIVSQRMTPEARQRFDPEDVVQEVLHEATRKWPGASIRSIPSADTAQEFPGPSNTRDIPFAWLYRLTIDRFLDHLRSIHRGVRNVSRELPLPDASALCLGAAFIASTPGPVTELQQAEMSETIRQALASLKDRDREVIWMRIVDQLSFKEIGDVVDIEENTANVVFVRAMRRLREACQRLSSDFGSST
jgi:RNA polymerase sigma factor (sigma-70 family)